MGHADNIILDDIPYFLCIVFAFPSSIHVQSIFICIYYFTLNHSCFNTSFVVGMNSLVKGMFPGKHQKGVSECSIHVIREHLTRLVFTSLYLFNV